MFKINEGMDMVSGKKSVRSKVASKKLKVLVTRVIPEKGLELLRKYFDVEVYCGPGTIPRAVLLSKVKGVDAVLSLLTEKIDSEVIDAGARLKIIANYAVGYDNIDVAYANSKGIIVTNTPGNLEDAVAEHTFALLFTLGRHVVEADAFVRGGKYRYWDPMLLMGTQFTGKTLGLVGLGRIGEAVALRARGLKMNVLYHDVVRHAEFEKASGVRFVSQDEVLKKSDFISLHVPLLPQTRHLISKKQFALMKKGVLLINTARGPVIDEKELVIALQQGKLGGAALDVFEFEPHIMKPLLRMKNVVFTPHIASATVEARDMMADVAARNIIAVLLGKKPISPL